jgi:hypothetical protein
MPDVEGGILAARNGPKSFMVAKRSKELLTRGVFSAGLGSHSKNATDGRRHSVTGSTSAGA